MTFELSPMPFLSYISPNLVKIHQVTEKQLLAVGKSEIVLIFGASESALPGDTKKVTSGSSGGSDCNMY